MLTQMLDRMIEQDPVLLAQRTADTGKHSCSSPPCLQYMVAVSIV